MLTPEQIAKMREKAASTPEALRRNAVTDYTEGWFFVTLNTRDDVPLLSTVEGRGDAPDGSSDAPRCVYTEIGRGVIESWRRNAEVYDFVEVHECEAMPEHFHGLIRLLPGNKRHLGRIIWGFMAGCSHAYWDALGIPWREMTYTKGVQTPEYNDRDHTHSKRGPALFVHGYNDVEAITEAEVQVKRQYIRDQSRKRLLQKGANAPLFRVHRDMQSRNWTPVRAVQGLCHDTWIARDRQKQHVAWQALTVAGALTERGKACHKLKAGCTIDLVGNMELLHRTLVPLVCHRADAARNEEQKTRTLEAARRGAVVVTACVSPKEREVVKLLLQELLPVVEVMANGFSERYKPVGKAFYAVAEGRRLEVSPWQYEYRQRDMRPVLDAQGHPLLDADSQPQMEEVPDIAREECMVMNEVVRVITAKADDWWKE